MVEPAGIDQSRDLLVASKCGGDRVGIVGLSLDTHRQGLKAFKQEPRVERRQRWTGLSQDLMVVIEDQLFRPQNDPAENPALTVDVLGGGIDDTIATECERALIERRRKNIVDDKSGAGIVRDVRNRRDIDNFQ